MLSRRASHHARVRCEACRGGKWVTLMTWRAKWSGGKWGHGSQGGGLSHGGKWIGRKWAAAHGAAATVNDAKSWVQITR